jgi:hypothetical protein
MLDLCHLARPLLSVSVLSCALCVPKGLPVESESRFHTRIRCHAKVGGNFLSSKSVPRKEGYPHFVSHRIHVFNLDSYSKWRRWLSELLCMPWEKAFLRRAHECKINSLKKMAIA